MRKTLVATTVATVLSAGAFLSSGASAMTTTAPAGFRPAIEHTNAVEATRYVCWRARRHGTWRRVCQWRPNYRYGYAYPRYSYGYGYGYGYPGYYARPYGYPYGYGYGYWGRPRAGVYLRF